MKRNFIILIASIAVTLCSCKEEDKNRVLSQYLFSRIEQAKTIIGETTEGVAEGEYKSGAHAYLRNSINKALAVYWGNHSQAEVDAYYSSLANDIETFRDKMHPFVSDMENLISQSDFVVNNTEVGDGDGKIPAQSDKDILSVAKNEAEEFMDGVTEDLTQRQLDVQIKKLTNALYAFEGKIPGSVSIYVENHSFEEPTMAGKCLDFTLIPGWNYDGWIDGLTPWAALNNKATGSYRAADAWWVTAAGNVRPVPDGVRFLNMFMYSKPVWQLLGEGLHPSCVYTMKVKVARFASYVSTVATGFRMQVVVFNDKPGNFNKATVIGELNIANISTIGDFAEKELIVTIPENHEMVGKRIAITFVSYYSSPVLATADPLFAWSPNENVGALMDQVVVTRKKAQ